MTTYVMQIILDKCHKKMETATASVFVKAEDDVSMDTLVKLATNKARESLKGFEHAICIDYRYLGTAKHFYIVG